MSLETQEKNKAPQWFIMKAVAVPILLGVALLMLPLSGRSGQWTDPLTALFMATSAMCVTGHTIVDVGVYFSRFGQLVMLGLVQLGGLGFTTLATVCLVLLGRRLSIQSEKTLTASLGVEEVNQLKRLLLRIAVFTFTVEALGALALAIRLVVGHGFPVGRAIYHGIFHAVSAFCNAGFSLYPGNLMDVREDKIFLLTITALIVLGGLGFLVVNELSIFKMWRNDRFVRSRLSLHARIVVWATTILILGGWLLFGAMEWNKTLAPLSTADKLNCALFQSVTPRTAGFNVVDMAQTRAATRFVTMVLMFVGGSPGSSAGGIKTTTAVVLLFTMMAMISGKREASFQNRTISNRVVKEALSVFLLCLVLVGAFYGLLLVSEEGGLLAGRFSSDALLFETISAFGTVGLSTGIVPSLSIIGKLLIVLGMYIGRVGPLTMALVVGLKDNRQLVRFPEEDVTIG